MMLNKVGFEAVLANGTFYFLCKHLNRESFRHSLCVWLLVVGAGPLGVVTAAVTVAVLGLTTAALRNGLRPSTPQVNKKFLLVINKFLIALLKEGS
jgi:hypothetical protein